MRRFIFAALAVLLFPCAARALPPMTRDEIIAKAAPAMGYSYWWGGGCWRTDGTCHGVCSTTAPNGCPNCTPSASSGCSQAYGADCSGLTNKVWGLPSTGTDITDCVHGPYSTATYYGASSYWTDQARSDMKRGDAFVYNNGSAGHVFVFESYENTNVWGNAWAYECKGCVAGCVHDLRAVTSSYIGKKRADVIEDAPDAGAPPGLDATAPPGRDASAPADEDASALPGTDARVLPGSDASHLGPDAASPPLDAANARDADGPAGSDASALGGSDAALVAGEDASSGSSVGTGCGCSAGELAWPWVGLLALAATLPRRRSWR